MKRVSARLAGLLAALALGCWGAAGAQTSAADHAAHHPAAASAAPAPTPLVDGEVRRIDREQGKLTLRHGRIANLDMPGMTMVFKVADTKMLDGLKEGDKVRFAADRVDGALTVTAIETAK